MQPHSNLVMLRGNLGADPEVRTTGKGVSVCNFKLATNERYLDTEGVAQKRTQWHKITVWGKMADVCGRNLLKGSEVSIIGKLVTNEYTDKEGYDCKDVEVHTTSVEFLRLRSNKERSQETEDVGGED